MEKNTSIGRMGHSTSMQGDVFQSSYNKLKATRISPFNNMKNISDNSYSWILPRIWKLVLDLILLMSIPIKLEKNDDKMEDGKFEK